MNSGNKNKKPFFFTTSWDDGTVHDLRLAELLAKYDLPATFYIARKHSYGFLPEQEIKALADRFELGAHTLNHIILNAVSNEVATDEIEGSKKWIEQLSGSSCKMFCFPKGKFRKEQINIVHNAGFMGARTVELMSLDAPPKVAGLFLFGTTSQCFPLTASQYLRNICSRGKTKNLWRYMKYLGDRNWVSKTKLLLEYAGSNGGFFHLWGHAWEIEQYCLWREIEEIFRVAAEYRKEGIYLPNGSFCLTEINK